MTDNNHPITPPPELIEDWIELSRPSAVGYADPNKIATLAARWGADTELEACVEWLGDASVVWNGDEEAHPGAYLRSARRPKPPSLKEQALKELRQFLIDPELGVCASALDTIRRALEQLPDDQG